MLWWWWDAIWLAQTLPWFTCFGLYFTARFVSLSILYWIWQGPDQKSLPKGVPTPKCLFGQQIPCRISGFCLSLWFSETTKVGTQVISRIYECALGDFTQTPGAKTQLKNWALDFSILIKELCDLLPYTAVPRFFWLFLTNRISVRMYVCMEIHRRTDHKSPRGGGEGEDRYSSTLF